jgi:Icc-related predicted phosphoesterase
MNVTMAQSDVCVCAIWKYNNVMPICFFVSDLHGKVERYQKLFNAILAERPAAVFLGGDLLPTLFSHANGSPLSNNFIHEILERGFGSLKENLGAAYPRIFIILGNDDPRSREADLIAGESKGMWEYVSNRCVEFCGYAIYGYAYVPPTPFLLKDWERYDVSRYVDPGCISPEEGWRSISIPKNDVKFTTIQGDLERLVGYEDLINAILLFHTPPYQTTLDRAALDGKRIEHVPLDAHIGSIAVRRLIELRQPLITLHGHIHESPSLTGSWRDQIGRTFAYSAAHNGHELALIRFDTESPGNASRELI